MLTGSIRAAEDWSIYPAAIRKALTFLKENDLAAHEPGRFELDGACKKTCQEYPERGKISFSVVQD